jgi:hypothetical protein
MALMKTCLTVCLGAWQAGANASHKLQPTHAINIIVSSK